MNKKKIVVFTGAGISAESGLKTFRDSDGLWENYKVEDVATPMAWENNPELVIEFYNKRRKQVINAKPNAAHFALVDLETKYDVHIITQNIDDLHERAGSEKIIHLHGEILKSRSSVDHTLVYKINGWRLSLGEKCENGSQLRPHVVWFGETVPNMPLAYKTVASAEIFIIIGTSLVVYPAAGIVDAAPYGSQKYLIDPQAINIKHIPNLTVIRERAVYGVTELVNNLLKKC